MTAKDLRGDFMFCREVERNERSSEIIKNKYLDCKERLNEAERLLFKSMNKGKALAVHDYIFSEQTIDKISEARHYSSRSIKSFIKEANEIFKALK